MKRILPILAALSLVLSGSCGAAKGRGSDTPPAEAPPVKESVPSVFFDDITVNGVKLRILERTTDPAHPVFLYLHGGPGHSIIPWAHVATSELVRDFTVVHYDQRGTGLSLYPDADPELNTMDQFMADCLGVTLYLKEKYHQEKIYLLGHSWGSVLGMRMIACYPEHYAGYIGVGQIVHWERQEAVSRVWIRERIDASGGDAGEREIAESGSFFGPYYGLLGRYGAIIHNLPEGEAGRIAAQSPWGAEAYTGDLFRRGLAFSHSGGDLYRAYTEANFFTEIPEVEVPVAFFCGRYDYLTAVPVAAEYLTGLKAPRTALYWFENSAHRSDIEEPLLFQERIRAFFLGR